LEDLGHAVGAADLCAAGVGAPHIRQRLFWVAESLCERRRQWSTGGGDAKYAASTSENAWGGDYGRCADGRSRRIDPRIPPLAHGVPARVVRLRGYGNAIVPQVAAEFISAYMECVA
jgi:DNA (cytosine-5)-methyltransferase 1